MDRETERLRDGETLKIKELKNESTLKSHPMNDLQNIKIL